MPRLNALTHTTPRSEKSMVDRALSLFADVRAGEGTTAVLMLINIFALLICYSVIKTVREPLILLGGGAEVRSYAAAGQALLLMGFVPLYSWFASRVDRVRLLVGVTLFFVACVELFAAAVAARVPYVGVAFFIWVGIFNISLVAQFWSFANDIYSKPAGDRLFPIIVIGMTAGAPIGSFVSARLFRLGIHPQSILQLSALLLTASVLLYVWINRRETRQATAPEAQMSTAGGFSLVLSNKYLRLVAALIVLLNVVNTTGEYLISRLLTTHVKELALHNPAFNAQAFIGAYVGEYQLWVNLMAFVLQAFVASRLVKHRGLAGVLLALPLIALGGYSIIAAGAGLSLVRHRLLVDEHRAAAPVAADDARREVQGEAGHRHVFCPRRRRAVRGRRLRRHEPAPFHHRPICECEHHADARLDWVGRSNSLSAPHAAARQTERSMAAPGGRDRGARDDRARAPGVGAGDARSANRGGVHDRR
jgi:ATP:ADP antiporter, AAA family